MNGKVFNLAHIEELKNDYCSYEKYLESQGKSFTFKNFSIQEKDDKEIEFINRAIARLGQKIA